MTDQPDVSRGTTPAEVVGRHLNAALMELLERPGVDTEAALYGFVDAGAAVVQALVANSDGDGGQKLLAYDAASARFILALGSATDGEAPNFRLKKAATKVMEKHARDRLQGH